MKPTSLKTLLLGSDPVKELQELKAANELHAFEPALDALHMKIPRGYRHKDNWEHSLLVLNNAIAFESNGPDLLLRTAALFHDIGKPATRAFGDTGVVTFRDHETVGSRQTKGLLTKHGYEKTDRLAVARLVALHMRAHGFGEILWSDAGVRRLAFDAGSPESLDRLIVIFYSDLTTKNAEKRNKITEGINRLEEALERVRVSDARKALRPALDGRELMELFGLIQGPELGKLTRFLNSEAGIYLDRSAALVELKTRFPEITTGKKD